MKEKRKTKKMTSFDKILEEINKQNCIDEFFVKRLKEIKITLFEKKQNPKKFVIEEKIQPKGKYNHEEK